ncbi:MAG: histidine phosphatase family protein [Ignavibacteriaceae bacterium]|nr:histidine phosphatase family protein [Ignavibacteriaceae bacterium]
MKTLYLTRHAKSSWTNPRLTDFDRPLNNRGKRDAPFMGKVLKDKKVKIGLIISSPAKRTKKTAIAIAEKLSYSEKKIMFNEDLYEASSNTLIKVIKKVDEKYDSVMIFAHNPGLTLLNNHISKNYIDNIPTCGIVALQLNNKWSEVDKNTCKFLFFEYPKLHRE